MQVKFTGSDLDDPKPHRYRNVFARQQTTGPERLVIGASSEHVSVMLRLAQKTRGPFEVLYVLAVSVSGREPGRYQSPAPMELAAVTELLTRYEQFIEGDGRHHVWLIGRDYESCLVYDNHNIMYAYGPLDAFERVLRVLGFSEGEVAIPSPHTHHYHAQNADVEQAFLSEMDWIHYPLVEEHDDP